MASLLIRDPAPDEAVRAEPVTAAHYQALADDGAFDSLRVELIDGEIVRLPPSHLPHFAIQLALLRGFVRGLDAAGSPLIAGTPASVQVNMHNVPEPDIIICEPVRGTGFLPVAAVRLVVEVCASTRAADLRRKPALYAGAGIPEYWVADIAARELVLMRAPVQGAYTEREVVPFGQPALAITLGITVATDGFD